MTRASLVWTTAAEPEGYEVVDFDRLRRSVSTRGEAGRRTPDNPAQPWLDRLSRMDALAVRGVRLHDLDDLRALHGLVLEPAWRRGLRLLVECDTRLSQLDPAVFVDPGFEHPYTLERALHAAGRIWRPAASPVAAGPPAPASPLDAGQLRAVDAPAGTVQIVAPAGSGKTTVLIERVRELLRRGVAAERILATTFNRAARVELQERLAAAGVQGVQARTFHSLGLRLLTEEGFARSGEPRSLSPNQWTRLCALAARETGVWVDVADARARVSDIKLGLLATPAEFSAHHTGAFADGETIARLYALYEEEQARRGVHDFDDLVLLAVRALRENAALRARWQGRFTHVLVDEYQDIEPAQELLVRILAAPQDELFCVGDDDQTLYGFRRASVRRMLDLDLAYPGLTRIALAHNYRCPPAVVAASRALIGHNRVRFPKPIKAAPGEVPRGPRAIELHEPASAPEGAARVAAALAASRRGAIVVLARTTTLLRTVALACAELGVRISAPPGVFDPSGAREAVEAYVRLCAAPADARAEDVTVVCRRPNRGLPHESAERAAERLRDGSTFAEAFAALPADPRRRGKLDQGAGVLDALAALTDARRFLRHLRTAGGLDAYFAEHDLRATEQIELEVLEQAEAEAAGLTVGAYGALLASRTDALRDIRDDEHGVELTTIHRAKGRQWPRVELFGAEEGQLPHILAFEVTPAQRSAGEGEEAERRLAYVAFTRAQRTLSITATGRTTSRFVSEAGLSPARPYVPPAPPPVAKRPVRRVVPGVPAPEHADPATAAGLTEATRRGLPAALEAAPDRAALAAAAVERDVGTEALTVTALLRAVAPCAQHEVAGLRPTAIVGRLDVGARRRLLKHLRALG